MTHVGPLVSPLLIGRDDPLDVADDRLREAAAGRGRFLLLAGEAGIGKSRLLAAIAARARQAGFAVAQGDVAPPDLDVPAASLLDLARTMARLPEWAETGRALLELTVDAAGGADARRRLLVYRMVELARRERSVAAHVCLRRPPVGRQPEPRDHRRAGARRSRDRPALIVGAFRSDEVAGRRDLFANGERA